MGETGCLLTVRTSSSRLPNKPLLEVRGKKLIEHVIDRMQFLKEADRVIMCTSTEHSDDILEKIANENGIGIFRGSLTDKMTRWLGAVEKFGFDRFVTIDAADDIFCDPGLIDRAIIQMKNKPCDYLKLPDSLVCGGAAPCISVDALRKACDAKDTDETEYYPIYFTGSGLFNVHELEVKDLIFHNESIRLTLDYQEDLMFFKKVFDELSIDDNSVPLKNILKFLKTRPDIVKINFLRQQDYLKNQKKIKKLVLKDRFVTK